MAVGSKNWVLSTDNVDNLSPGPNGTHHVHFSAVRINAKAIFAQTPRFQSFRSPLSLSIGIINGSRIQHHTKDFSDTAYVGSEVLLLHRYEDFAWDNNNPIVHVFGMKQAKIMGQGLLSVAMWRPKTMQLADSAVMAVPGPLAPSQLAILGEKKAQGKVVD